MKKYIWIILIVAIVVAAAFFVIKKEATQKQERNAYSGYTRAELKRKLELAWKDRHFEASTAWITTAPEAAEWYNNIKLDAAEKGHTVEQGVLHAVQFGWAKDKPKAWDNQWSRGWLEHIYLKEQGIEATPEVKQLLREI